MCPAAVVVVRSSLHASVCGLSMCVCVSVCVAMRGLRCVCVHVSCVQLFVEGTIHTTTRPCAWVVCSSRGGGGVGGRPNAILGAGTCCMRHNPQRVRDRGDPRRAKLRGAVLGHTGPSRCWC